MGGAARLLVLLATPFPRPSALRLARHRAVPLAALSAAASTASSYSSHHFRPLHPRLRLGFSVVTAERFHTQLAGTRDDHGEAVASAPTSHAGAMRSWPEWTKLVDYLVAGGYYDWQDSVVVGEEDDDSLLAGEDLTEEFVKAAQACLSFARDKPDLLRMLAKKDIEIIVENGSPFLFKNGANSERRLQSFVVADGTKVLESERAQTVDIMRYLLSYACSSTATRDESFFTTRDLTETAIRSLLAQLFRLSVTSPDARLTEMTPRQTVTKQHFSRPTGQNIEMKRGDWICPKCSFMNFARNMGCLECNEARPKKILSDGEWECPQCDFFNFSRNISCLRCDFKRPGGNPFGTAPSDAHLGYNGSSTVEQILKRSNLDKSEIERKLAANDEKAERWFSKISQLDDSADLSSAIDDEDFPEIMPMRKGMNRFVVSTRKTPLERRLANAQNRSNLGNSGFSEGHELQPGRSNGMNSHKPSESSISQMLDRILGRSSTSSETSHPVVAGGDNSSTGSRFSSSDYRQGMVNQRTDPDSVPFVPLPADMFSKNSNPDNKQSPNTEDSASAKASQLGDPVFKESESSAESRDSDSFDTSKGWSKKVTELDNVRDMANAISDDDFPEIMPMRKGENRFIVSKKKDRSLTSLQYKRRIAMEQANSVNFVPFVPFPPDYFAKKDKQPETSPTEGSTLHEKARSETEKSEESMTGVANSESGGNATRQPENWSANQSYHGTTSTNPPCMDLTYRKMDAYNVGGSVNSAQPLNTSWRNQSEIPSTDFSQKNTYSGPSVSASSRQTENSKSASESWKPSFSGKSLEGSAVTEPDPLDMSEEAKAARWFRRAAQIKDISELSNIPDEDFPEIMPMRKGVNRFVVSKRKTPLERRLTSPQYRRSLPIIRSEPDEDVN
ncbi:hypothetical protein C4D60_Mb07t05680 [Musa balbisiana]|uniref:RanBP2-type domain-containing protein n=1 Tax=Musa balbisiana TaxID=52838 RepID=A0A4S8JFR1_MUSBA|nr:hypothetical protein C4D60_Mb07t05680 [Musa balbisiana]